MIRLGDTVKDSVSGFKGIAVAEYIYLNGCNRFEIQPPVVEKEGQYNLPESKVFDENQLIVIEKGTIKSFQHQVTEIPGGPKDHRSVSRR